MQALRTFTVLLPLVAAQQCEGDASCVAVKQENLLLQSAVSRQKLIPHPDESLAGNTAVDTSSHAWCSYKWKLRQKTGQLPSTNWADKFLLFIQSGPHTGSTLLNEALSGFSDAAPLCRHWKGHHAEVQTQLINKKQDWPMWSKSWKINEYVHVRKRRIPADNMTNLPAAIEDLFLHPERKVRILKSPQAVYFTQAFRQAFPHKARFIILVNEPYSWAQHLQQTYFKKRRLDIGYRTAAHMAADMYTIQMEAAKKANGDALVVRYEDFTEQPAIWLKKIQAWMPELGHVPHFKHLKLSIHGRISEIKNMNNLYLKELSPTYRRKMTKYFRKYERTISYFGYKLDGNGTVAGSQADTF